MFCRSRGEVPTPWAARTMDVGRDDDTSAFAQHQATPAATGGGAKPKRVFLKRGEGVQRRIYGSQIKATRPQATRTSSRDAAPQAVDQAVPARSGLASGGGRWDSSGIEDDGYDTGGELHAETQLVVDDEASPAGAANSSAAAGAPAPWVWAAWLGRISSGTSVMACWRGSV